MPDAPNPAGDQHEHLFPSYEVAHATTLAGEEDVRGPMTLPRHCAICGALIDLVAAQRPYVGRRRRNRHQPAEPHQQQAAEPQSVGAPPPLTSLLPRRSERDQ